jgi:hypothetical protein
MASENSVQARSGVSFLSLLGLLFIGLKLTDNIDWSWWLVLAPFWVGPAIIVILLLGIVLVALINTPIKK